MTSVAFVSISSSATSYTYRSVTYYHVNPWYRRALREGEEGYVLSTAPVGHQADQLPKGSETVEFSGKTYYYSEASFWQKASGGGYVVVKPPVGAEVSSVPEQAMSDVEGEVTTFQYDGLYLTRDTDNRGNTIYRVEPSPPEEELDAIPPGSPAFVADDETYYYVDYAFYVEFEENGKKGFVNGEPSIGAQVEKLPREATSIEDAGETYYQFDSVFFEEVESDDGTIFFEVVGSPGERDEELQS